ncbi:MAG: hypothetical protein ACRBFS_19305 [Aureispira sp.]
MVNEDTFFYDFIIGVDQDKKQWKERNIKMPASNPLHALQLYRLFTLGRNNIDNYYFKNLDFAIKPLKVKEADPILYFLKYSVRRIIEYKKTSTNGRTQPRFKRSRVFFISDGLKLKEVK